MVNKEPFRIRIRMCDMLSSCYCGSSDVVLLLLRCCFMCSVLLLFEVYYLCACVRMCEWAACLPEVCLLLLQIKDYVGGNCKQTSVVEEENECIYLLLVVHLSLSFRFSLKAY